MAKQAAQWILLGYVPLLAMIKGLIYYIHSPQK